MRYRPTKNQTPGTIKKIDEGLDGWLIDKGKDTARENMNNERPITLTNVDY